MHSNAIHSWSLLEIKINCYFGACSLSFKLMLDFLFRRKLDKITLLCSIFYFVFAVLLKLIRIATLTNQIKLQNNYLSVPVYLSSLWLGALGFHRVLIMNIFSLK